MNHAAALAEIHEVMRRLEPEPEHTAHVARLAMRLFDGLADLHGLTRDHRVLLEGAACLHDIGWPVSDGGSAHHKHSARLIRKQKWTQFTPDEIEIMAQVARYHRRALPCPDHDDFARLRRSRQDVVRKLGAMLRLADAFDRSHLQLVRDVRVRVTPRLLEFTLVSREPPAREIAGGEKKGDLAREVWGLELTFRFEPIRPRSTV